MRAALLLTVLATTFLSALADDITFTNKTASFTDLQGRHYRRVQLVRGDLDGLIWRSGASGGRICYTNLDPDLLESLGVSSNRIDIARVRAQRKAVADARYRAQRFAEGRAKLREKAGLTNATPTESGSNAPALTYAPGAAYSPDSLYGTGYPYLPILPYGFIPASAPSATPSGSAGSAASAPSAPGGASGPSAAPGPSAATASPTQFAPPAARAPMAPPAFVPPSIARRGH